MFRLPSFLDAFVHREQKRRSKAVLRALRPLAIFKRVEGRRSQDKISAELVFLWLYWLHIRRLLHWRAVIRQSDGGWPHQAVEVRLNHQCVVVLDARLAQHDLLVCLEDRVRLVVSNVPHFWYSCPHCLLFLFREGKGLRAAKRAALQRVFK